MSEPAPRGAAGRVGDAFVARTGHSPQGVWAAPGRVNLIGEHLDYNGGHVLPLAIDRHVAVAVSTRAERVVRCWSAHQTEPVEVPLSDLAGASGWSAYPLGVLWALGELGVEVPGLDLVFDSDVPLGAGLSSSAAIECAVAVAVDDLAGAGLDRATLARAAQRGENEVVGAPVGIMDQMASLFGLAGHALYLDCRSYGTEMVPLYLRERGYRLLVVGTPSRHDLADGGYASRRSACEAAARALGVAWLTDCESEALASAGLPEELLRRARHVVTEEQRTREAAELLREGALRAVGPLLTASHRSLACDFEVSTPELDAVVTAALGAGAAGARLTGGGFGGSAIALVAEDAFDAVREAASRAAMGALRASKAAGGAVAPLVEVVAAADGAHRVT